MADIGIMGGTFDPIHNGHLLLAKQAYNEYRLDQIWFMPSGQPPHKQGRRVSSAKDRCQMVKLAIADTDYFTFSDFEVAREGYSYTAQTLRLLQDTYPEHRFYFIIGADSLYEIESWYHPELVMQMTVLLVAGREYDAAVRPINQQIEYLKQKYDARIFRLHCQEVDIASAELRQMASRDKKLYQYVPAGVEHYIETHQLYQKAEARHG